MGGGGRRAIQKKSESVNPPGSGTAEPAAMATDAFTMPDLPSDVLHRILVDFPSSSRVAKELEVCTWLFTEARVASSWLGQMASEGRLEVLKWAVLKLRDHPHVAVARHYLGAFRFVCVNAAACGHLEVLQWARSQGMPWDEDVCTGAAEGGHLPVLQWAHAAGCPWDHTTCARAALAGHLEALRWARANGCPWDEYTCTSAARAGHLALLQWARANGCPWNKHTCRSAAKAEPRTKWHW